MINNFGILDQMDDGVDIQMMYNRIYDMYETLTERYRDKDPKYHPFGEYAMEFKRRFCTNFWKRENPPIKVLNFQASLWVYLTLWAHWESPSSAVIARLGSKTTTCMISSYRLKVYLTE
jgi:hypothetical protein